MERRSIRKWIVRRHAFLRRDLTLLAVLAAFLSMSAVVFAFGTKRTIDGVELADSGVFTTGVTIVITVLLAQIVLKAIDRYFSALTVTRADNALKERLFTHVLHLDHQAGERHHSGAFMNALESDARTVSEGVVELFIKAIFLTLRFVLAFALLFYLDVFFASVMLVVGLFFLAGSVVIRQTIKRRHNILRDQEGRRRGFMQESIANTLLIKAFEAEPFTSSRLEEHNAAYLDALMNKQKVIIFASGVMNLFFAGGYAFAVIYGALSWLEGALMVGSLVAIIQLIQYMQSPFSGLSSLLPRYYSVMASAERLMRLETEKREGTASDAGEVEFSSIEIEDVTFSYGKLPVLKDFSLTVSSGEFVHVRGDSGIGKTTLLKLLLGVLSPEKGGVFLRSENQTVSASPVTRHLFSYVPQGLMILSGTIRDNVAYNLENVSDARIREALRVAALDDTVESLKDGLETPLGERGTGLSEGQLQRLSIARAVMRDAPVLLLDEATSALDADTELEVLENIKNMTDKTCVFISHRRVDGAVVDKTVDL